uniref:Uncharacterized protein n=1 Tax=Cacopsylla melanoneura TaxID=428564 RepID=A0A8D9E7G3_9HEMI
MLYRPGFSASPLLLLGISSLTCFLITFLTNFLMCFSLYRISCEYSRSSRDEITRLLLRMKLMVCSSKSIRQSPLFLLHFVFLSPSPLYGGSDLLELYSTVLIYPPPL